MQPVRQPSADTVPGMTYAGPWLTTHPLLRSMETAMRDAVIARLPVERPAGIEQESLETILQVFGFWRFRLVSAQRRRVHYSAELRVQLASSPHAAAVQRIATAIERGGDLSPYMSERAAVAYAPGAERSEKAVDRLLAHWGAHHLHLGPLLPGKRFAGRTRDLLFAAFGPEDAYLIGVYDHHGWADRTMLKVMNDNWPHAGLVHLSDGLQYAEECSDAEVGELRRAGVSVGVNIDGKAALARTMSVVGTPLDVVDHVNQIVHVFWQLDSGLNERGLKALDERLVPKPHRDRPAEWHPVITDDANPQALLLDETCELRCEYHFGTLALP